MVVIYNKLYVIISYIVNDNDIYSPSMPYTWKWAIGKSNHSYPLGIFDNLKQAKIIQQLLFNTHPAKINKAIPIIRIYDTIKTHNLIKIYNISINKFYLESFTHNKISHGYNLHQINYIFKHDTIS